MHCGRWFEIYLRRPMRRDAFPPGPRPMRRFQNWILSSDLAGEEGSAVTLKFPRKKLTSSDPAPKTVQAAIGLISTA
jgi:hypothetical protein